MSYAKVEQLHSLIKQHSRGSEIAVNVKVNKARYYTVDELCYLCSELNFGKTRFYVPYEDLVKEVCKSFAYDVFFEMAMTGVQPLNEYIAFLQLTLSEDQLRKARLNIDCEKPTGIPFLDNIPQMFKSEIFKTIVRAIKHRRPFQDYLTIMSKNLHYDGRSNGWIIVGTVDEVDTLKREYKETAPDNQKLILEHLKAYDYIIDGIKTRRVTEQRLEFQLKLTLYDRILRLHDEVYVPQYKRKEEIDKKKQGLFKYYTNRPGRNVLIPIVKELLDSLSDTEIDKKHELYCKS